MRKNLVAAFALAGLMALSLCACDGSAGTGDDFAKAGNQRTTIAEQETYTGLSSAESVYAMGAVTTAGFFASDRSAAASLSVRTLSSADQASEEQSAAKEEAEDFNKYLNMIESFLDEEQLKTVVEQNTDSAYSDYDIKLTVVGKDINGEDVLHVLYYTETFTREEKKEKGDESERETKTEYSLTGVMLLGDEEYAVRGERKEESKQEKDGEKTKSEIRIRAYSNAKDAKTYVEMSYSTETEDSEEERAYVYTVVKNGVFKEKTVVTYKTETKQGVSQTKYFIYFYGTETGARSIYSIERELDESGREILTVFYRIVQGTNTDGGAYGDRGSHWYHGPYGYYETYGEAEQGYYRIRKDENGDYVYLFHDGSVRHFYGRHH